MKSNLQNRQSDDRGQALAPRPALTSLHSAATFGRVVVVVLVAGLVTYPALYGLLLGGEAAIFRFFTSDTFYYLSIANNSKNAFYTFDGVYPTNGVSSQ